MLITREHFHEIMIQAQTMAQAITRLQEYANYLALPNTITMLKQILVHIPPTDAIALQIFNRATSQLLALHERIEEIQFDSEIINALPRELAQANARAQLTKNQTEYRKRTQKIKTKINELKRVKLNSSEIH